MWPWVVIRELQVRLTERDSQLEQLRLDHAELQQEYRNLVGQIGNLATRPVAGSLFDQDDPYKEDGKRADEWVSPDTNEIIDYQGLLDHANGTRD